MNYGTVIAGGGLAAQRCAEALRRAGYTQPVTIAGAEAVAPYDRPPLSKAYLAGEIGDEDIALRPGGWHAANDIELVLGDPATGVDVDRRRLLLASGTELPYRHLVIATGSRPRALPGTEGLQNVHTLRTLDDARRLATALRPGRRLAVLGAGLIGQEVAATAHRRGAQVVLIEAESLPLARALHPEMARWLVEVQRQEGVEVRLGARVEHLDHDGTRLHALRLQDGSTIEVDELLVAIGVRPNDDWLPAPLAELLERPEIHAAGDVRGADHWEAAVHDGRAVAQRILGGTPRPAGLTSWWSDVHGTRIQGLGSPAHGDVLEVDGDPAGREFTAVAHRDGRPVSALAVGRPHELPRLRTLLRSHTTPAEEAS